MDSLQLLPLKGDLTQPAPTLVPVETIPLKAQREAALMASTVHRWHLEKGLCWHASTPIARGSQPCYRLAPSSHVAEETSDSSEFKEPAPGPHN